MKHWTSAGGIVFLLAHVEVIATGKDPGTQIGGNWYPLSQAEAGGLRDAVIDGDF